MENSREHAGESGMLSSEEKMKFMRVENGKRKENTY